MDEYLTTALNDLAAHYGADVVLKEAQHLFAPLPDVQPVARSTDRGTSWAAARSIDPAKLRPVYRNILDLLRMFAPEGLTDNELWDKYSRRVAADLAPRVSPSGLRSRRAELVDAHLVVDSGLTVKLPSGRQSTVWQAA